MQFNIILLFSPVIECFGVVSFICGRNASYVSFGTPPAVSWLFDKNFLNSFRVIFVWSAKENPYSKPYVAQKNIVEPLI
jgi:hypothetical protein